MPGVERIRTSSYHSAYRPTSACPRMRAEQGSPKSGWGRRGASHAVPNIDVAGLTIETKSRRLYAASHGLGVWLLRLPDKCDDDDDK